MFRKTVFWIHLVCGVATCLVVLMMSVTGVILTYERQMLAWANPELTTAPAARSEPLAVEEIVAAAAAAEPEFQPTSVTVPRDSGLPYVLGAGRGSARFVDPYSAEWLGSGPERLQAFFGAVTGWHRWFNVSGPNRGPWRAVTGASNLIFLFLIFSGMYLWLPRIYKWAMFRTRLLFNAKHTTSHARDFNWHHVFGIWSAIPLAIVVATATVFSYPWASDLVYRTFGEEPPGRGPAAPGPALQGVMAVADIDAAPERVTAASEPMTLDALLAAAASRTDGWQSIAITLPDADSDTVRFTIDEGNGGQPQLRHNLVLDRHTAEIVEWAPFDSQTPGRQARLWVRFLHTGEALGIVGQTVAGIVSATSVLMVWTGIALAWRRLISPLFRKRKTAV